MAANGANGANGVRMVERLSDRLLIYLQTAVGRDVNLKDIKIFLNIEPGSKDDTNLRTLMSTNLVARKVVKPSGRSDGVYRVLTPVEPVKWWDDSIDEEPINFYFPKCHEDNTEFGIEDLVEVFAGDLILISGQSNYGKTTIALNILGENLSLMPAVLMGSEYTASNGKISPKFKRRMNRMSWVNWTEDGKPRFQLLPVGADFEDYIEPDLLNVIDWVSLPGEYYLIDRVMKAIKDKVGTGIVVMVLQKNKGAEFGEGGERTQRYADVELLIDEYGQHESMLTIGKVKAPKGKAKGRKWAFSIVDYGANLHGIREIVKCPKCWGKGYTGTANNYKRCDICNGLKFIDK